MNQSTEWLEADGWGGFASGTAGGPRTRRYHALLLVARTPPTDRFVLVNGFDAWVETAQGVFPLSSQRYASGVVYPDGARWLEAFHAEPWPQWLYRLGDGTQIELELFVPHGMPLAALRWRRLEGAGPATLIVRPLLSGRDYHSLQRENPAFCFDAAPSPSPLPRGEGKVRGGRVAWRPYDGVPATVALFNGQYEHQPLWYRDFLYEAERDRGLDCIEDLASPGLFRWNLAEGDALWLLTSDAIDAAPVNIAEGVEDYYAQLRTAELQRRSSFASPLHRAADAYVVNRNRQVVRPSDAGSVTKTGGKTIVAGYPWFTDWGRDTFISLRGLCLATGRLDDAGGILSAWAGAVSEGMLPNRFPDRGAQPEFNAVDASLWFVVAVYEYLDAVPGCPPAVRQQLIGAVEEILSGYARGTRYGIRLDDDGLLAAGEPGVQLTWMDAKVGDWVVTPRIGKPVEVEALWLNALWIADKLSINKIELNSITQIEPDSVSPEDRSVSPDDRSVSPDDRSVSPDDHSVSPNWRALFERGRDSFHTKFWNEEAGCLYDVVDCDHREGSCDASFRPNQIMAIGGLPLQLLEGERARRVVDAVEARLWTPMGLRTLAADDAAYRGRCDGGVHERDGAYHQGTAWQWLLGPFVEGWVRVRGNTPQAKREARARFLEPLEAHLNQAGLGHVSEIADGDPPHTPRGCPFQAWSVGELLRLSLRALAEDSMRDER